MNFLEWKEATRPTLLLIEVLLRSLYLAHFDQEAGYIYSHITNKYGVCQRYILKY